MFHIINVHTALGEGSEKPSGPTNYDTWMEAFNPATSDAYGKRVGRRSRLRRLGNSEATRDNIRCRTQEL